MPNIQQIAKAYAQSEETYKDYAYALKVSTPAVLTHSTYVPWPERAAMHTNTESVVFIRDLVGKFIV